MRLGLPGRLRWWHLYVVLLAASHLWQLAATRPASPDPEQKTVAVPRQRAEGPAGGGPVTIAYREAGSGQPVIYLHGSPGSGRDSRRLGGRIADRFRLLAPDLPGFGASDPWLPDYGIEAHARYVLAFMDALGIDRAHLVTHSMGSGVALHMSRLAPQRVRSIVAYAGIGIQEGEGSGDYYLEHAKYAAGYLTLVVLPEIVPHFGWLGDRAGRHGFIRNFWDTDQRPLRDVLASLEAPFLIVHGRHDPLVAAWVAEAHHEIVRHSELVMLDASHFLVFTRDGAARLARELIPFLVRHTDPSAAPMRRTVDRSSGARTLDPLASRLELDLSLGPYAQIGALMLATFVTEDLTCIAAGLLARAGRMDFFVAIVGCLLGIYVGDLGLWLVGRLAGRRVLRWRWISRRFTSEGVDRFGQRFDRHLGKAVVASRFLPGTRLPMYLIAGVVSRRPLAFFVWLIVAAAVWTPILVLAAMVFGPVAVRPFEIFLGASWLSWIGAAAVLFAALRAVELASSWRGRRRLAAAVSRLWRWEFWPVWLFYIPVFAWIGVLALRYRGLTTPTATNPAQPHGGFVGESKSDILERLPEDAIQPSLCVEAAEPGARLESLRGRAEALGWSLPLVLKPDAGQRGAGLKLVRDWEATDSYLRANPGTVLAQTYHPGPHEAGVFYYRFPDAPTGRIFSITDKRFPEAVGDGRSTLEELILGHPRLRMQWKIFARRHARSLGTVPAQGERVRLAVAGNHCQGTLFRDGSRLRTPELERAFDRIARRYEGFYLGRFDVRYGDAEEFKAGRGFRIIELNGVTSEATHVYDPTWSLPRAWITLCRQWSLAFRIGAANRRAGHRASRLGDLLRAVLGHYRGRTVETLAD